MTVRELRNRGPSIAVLLVLIGMMFSKPALAVSLTVVTAQESYMANEYITISGIGIPGDYVSIAVNLNDTIIFESSSIVNQDGNFTITFLMPGDQPGVYTVVASISFDSAETQFQILDRDNNLAHNLLELLAMSREKAQTVIEQDDVDPVIVEESYEKFQMAEAATEEGRQLFSDGKYQEAAEKITEALRLYGESIKLINISDEKPIVDRDAFIERILELKGALERTRLHIEKVNTTAAKFEEDGLDASSVYNLIEESHQLLNMVEAYLDEGLIEEAKATLSNAQTLLREAMVLIQELNEYNKVEKARRFLTETENRLNLMEVRITNILGNIGVSDLIISEVSDVFVNAKLGIADVKTLLDTGEFEEARIEFAEVVERTREGLNVVDEFDGKKREILGTVEALEAKINYLAERIEVLRNASFDVSRFDSKYDYVMNLLNSTVQKLEEDYVAQAQELLAEVVRIVKVLEDELEYHYRKLREASLSNQNSLSDVKTDDTSVEGTSQEASGIEGQSVSGARNDFSLEFRTWIDKLEESLVRITNRIHELRGTGYDTSGLETKVEMVKRMIGSAVEFIEMGNWEAASGWISEAGSLLRHLDQILTNIRTNTSNTNSDSTTMVTDAIRGDEDTMTDYSVELEELETAFANLWNLVESMDDAGTDIEPYLHNCRALFSELLESEPGDDLYQVKKTRLWEMLEEVEVMVKETITDSDTAISLDVVVTNSSAEETSVDTP